MTGTMTRNNHRPEPRVRGDICPLRPLGAMRPRSPSRHFLHQVENMALQPLHHPSGDLAPNGLTLQDQRLWSRSRAMPLLRHSRCLPCVSERRYC